MTSAGTGSEVEEPLVGRRVAGLEDVARVVGDDADRDAQEVVDRAHPLGVAPGEVVVDGDDVGTAAGEGVEDRREGGDEGLAFARLHLGDLALMEDDPPEELDVEVPHPEGPLHRLTGGGEDLGQDLVEGLVDPFQGPPTALLGELAPTLEVRMVELVLARLGLAGDLLDLGPEGRDPVPDLGVGERLELRLEGVRPLDVRPDSFQLTFVGIDEAGED